MEISFFGGAYEGRSKNLNAQICQNWIPVLDNLGGKSQQAMIGTPGLKQFCNIGVAAQSRGALVWKDYLWVVLGSTLYRIDSSGVSTSMGTLNTSSGRVYMAGGTTHLCITDGRFGYYKTATDTTLTQIPDADFPIATSLCYLDGFFIVSEHDTDAIYISALENASSWGALDFASAEEQPDDVIAIHTHLRHLFALGEQTMEIFFNRGDPDYPFVRVAGAVNPFGLGARASVASGREGMFFLDDNRQIRMVAGYGAQVISTEQIDYHIRKYSTVSDAYGYTYTQEGHGFYVLTFPTPSKTWVFDVSTGLWHTRSSGLQGNQHRSAWHQWFADKNLVGDPDNGKIYELDLDTYTDDGELIRSIRVAQPVHAGRKYIFHHSLELEFEAGVGLSSGQGSDPQAMLDWSDDDGKTWSNELWCGIGKIGEYENRAVWRRLGRSRSRIYRLTMTDPVKRVLVSAHLDGDMGIA